MKMPVIRWTLTRLRRFERAYEAALSEGVETFWFDCREDGKHEFVVGYAKYLIQYLYSQVKQRRVGTKIVNPSVRMVKDEDV
jgi:hypothetical protein